MQIPTWADIRLLFHQSSMASNIARELQKSCSWVNTPLLSAGPEKRAVNLDASNIKQAFSSLKKHNRIRAEWDADKATWDFLIGMQLFSERKNNLVCRSRGSG